MEEMTEGKNRRYLFLLPVIRAQYRLCVSVRVCVFRCFCWLTGGFKGPVHLCEGEVIILSIFIFHVLL